MNRATVTVLATAVALAACAERQAPASSTMDPRSVHAELAETSVADLQAAMERGDLTSRELIAGYLARIAALDDAGPALNAVIEINPDALAEAERRDEERRTGKIRGPLHGIPILLKDNIDAVGMVNSAGSLALAEHRPAVDAPVVARLREAGAVILGKTNLSEWANFRGARSSSGWSGRGGQTRNPHVLDRSPCGSSSGSGVAVAAGLAPLAVGTETDGSILCPSAVNGIVGIKPTLGRVSRSGIIPIAPAQDTAGPMAQTVADAALLLEAMAGADARDPITESAPGPLALVESLDPNALRGARIGVLRQTMGFHAGVDAVMERSIQALRAAGAEVVDPVELPTHGKFRAAETEVLLHEFRPALETYLAESGAPVRSLDALIEFNRSHRETEMPWFGQERFEQAAAKPALTDPAYLAARDDAKRLAGPEGIDAALATHDLDALLAPAVSPAWPVDWVNGDHVLGAGYSSAAVAGYPSITVPAGAVHGLPVGIVFMGEAWSEARLVGFAHAFEQATRARTAPAYRPTLAD